MPICKKCDQKFPSRIEVDGVTKNLGSRKFCLSCSPWGLHNTSKLGVIDDPKKCAKCKVELTADNSYILGRGGSFSYCKSCERLRVNTRNLEAKLQAVNYKGGKCIQCGYAKCLAAMDFHHRDHTKKEFKISDFLKDKGLTEELKDELDKCVLVCRNCHSEIHAGVTQLVE